MMPTTQIVQPVARRPRRGRAVPNVFNNLQTLYLEMHRFQWLIAYQSEHHLEYLNRLARHFLDHFGWGEGTEVELHEHLIQVRSVSTPTPPWLWLNPLQKICIWYMVRHSRELRERALAAA
jgi:hypothetical protein